MATTIIPKYVISAIERAEDEQPGALRQLDGLIQSIRDEDRDTQIAMLRQELGNDLLQKPKKKLYSDDEQDELEFDRSELVKGYIPKGKLVEVFGAAGNGKTFLILDIALTVAQQFNVVYLAAEDFEEIPERKKAWRYHHQAQTKNFYLWDGAVQLFAPASVEEFLSLVEPLKPALIVVDPFVNNTVGKSVTNEEGMKEAMESLNKVRIVTGATILVCHHTGWSEAHERDSSVMRGAMRAVYKIANNGDGLITMSCEKNNNSEKPKNRYFKITSIGNSAVVIPSSRLARTNEISEAKEIVLTTLNLAVYRDGATHKEIMEYTNFAKSTLSGYLSDLIDNSKGALVQKDKKDRYTLTNRGRQHVDNMSDTFESSQDTSTDGTGRRFYWDTGSD